MRFSLLFTGLILITSPAGADLFTPLTQAVVQTTSGEAIDALIETGGDVNAVDDKGRTVLMLAAQRNTNPQIIYLLAKHGANVNQRTPDDGKTALFFAVMHNPNPAVVMHLLHNGADPLIKDLFGKTAYDYIDRNPKLIDTEADLALDYLVHPVSSESVRSR